MLALACENCEKKNDQCVYITFMLDRDDHIIIRWENILPGGNSFQRFY